MRTYRRILPLAVLMALHGSTALAQTTSTSDTQTSTSTQSTQSAFDKLSPGGQKIALALCGAQAGGCPTGQSASQTTSASTQTASSSKALTLNEIAWMKQHRGWGEIFKDMQKGGQIPAGVKNLGQLVSGRYQSQSSGTTISTATGKTHVEGSAGNSGNSGTPFAKAHAGDDSAGSSVGGTSSSAGSHSAASSHGGGHGK